MKKILIAALVALFALPAYAQSGTTHLCGYVNTQTILSAIPEYKVATDKLQALSKQYSDKIQAELSKVDALYNTYQKEKGTLSPSERQAKEDEIIAKEKEVKQLKQNYFGEDGTMQKKTEELVGPIRERVQNAIDKIAAEKGYMIIFDISAMQGVIYADSASDLSDTVIKALE